MVAVKSIGLKDFLSKAEFETAGDVRSDPEYLLGKSVSTLTGATGNLAIDRPAEIPNVGIGTHFQDLTILTTYSELERYLSFSSGGGGVVYGVKMDGAASYLERERSVQYAMYAILRVSARTKSYSLLDRQLRGVVQREIPTDNNDRDARQGFYEKWGDAYVQKVVYGGELLAIIEITRNSYSKYVEAKAEFSGSYLETYKGSAEYESTRSLILKKSEIGAKILVRGRTISPPLSVSTTADESRYNAQALFDYADGFGAKVREEGVAEAMEMEFRSLKETDNWPRDVNPISVDDAVHRTDRLLDLLIQAEKLQIEWQGLIYRPYMYEIPGARQDPDIVARKRTEAQQLLLDLQGVIQGIREERRQIERHPLAFDPESQFDWEPAFRPFRLVPMMKRTIVPTIVTQAFQIKYRPSSGRGHAPNQNKTYTVDESNSPRLNWFPAEGTDRKQFVRFSVGFGGAEQPLDLGLEYQVKLMEVMGPPRIGFPNGRVQETQPVPLGHQTPGDENHRVWEVRFRLTGLMKEAYSLEYQVHAGDGRGTSAAIAGNTPRATYPEWTYLGNEFHLEGIRLAIFPKYKA